MEEIWLQKQKKANEYFQERKYDKAVDLYEESIELKPTIIENYWYLGLALLILGKEDSAQAAWMIPILSSHDEEEQEKLIKDLSQILEKESQNQESQQQLQLARLIRQYIQEILPQNVDNLLKLLILAIRLQNFSEYNGLIEKINERLQCIKYEKNGEILLDILDQLLKIAPDKESVIDFAKICSLHVESKDRITNILLKTAHELSEKGQAQKAISLGEICMQLSPNHPKVFKDMAGFLQNSGKHLESIPVAEKSFAQAERWGEKLAALYSQIRGWVYAGGHWRQAYAVYQQHQKLLEEIITKREELDANELLPIISAGIFSAYFEDSPQKYRPLRNQYAKLCQDKLQTEYQEQVNRYQEYISKKPYASKKINIGYLSNCFYNHSVSWIARWPLWYHDRERFEVHAYSTKHIESPLQKTLAKICQPNFHQVNLNINEIIEKIVEDEIDILVDLDSLTSNINSAVMALKPSPIQVSWLGFDASGFPSIDYFLADPYVLPESASEYYAETIWRLPQTYVAVDGFEVAVPTLRRDRMGVPQDSIVYLSAQSGAKRNPNNVKAQIQILKEVPNSFLFVKSMRGDMESLQAFFEQIAESEGVSSDRLRFLSKVPLEATHRGNLRIADVVLDTYPYNGATTTLETLWMEIPIVTQVGTQFAARNSYTMLLNAGVTAGIAWSQEEYIEWGIRLGKDPQLRQNISWQLRVGKKTAPLWNSEQFTRDLEKAYEQMWQKFLGEA
ncbi:hypothetical protein [Geitlerinema sp. PCC 9228]|uniref:O-linked N-acetylglucosamine transferase, SPINDLY family protein n=1 Tax=Geitlerinema sp. PCC 9228 TaxID=111611 RepID=UPI0008F9D7B4|nr:hypothetical protein [Geitlerinema sp. PCC 9228]